MECPYICVSSFTPRHYRSALYDAMVVRDVCLYSYVVASKGHVLVKCGDRMTAIKTSLRWCAQWELRGMKAGAEKCTLWTGSGVR